MGRIDNSLNGCERTHLAPLTIRSIRPAAPGSCSLLKPLRCAAPGLSPAQVTSDCLCHVGLDYAACRLAPGPLALQPGSQDPLRLADHRDSYNANVASDARRYVPLEQGLLLAAELHLVGMVTDGEIECR